MTEITDETEVTEVISESTSTDSKKTEPPKPSKFKRVAIEEDSSEEEEPKIEETTQAPKNDDMDIRKIVKGIDSKFPLKTAKEIEAHTREAKILMKQGATAFQKKWENRDEKKSGGMLIEEIDKPEPIAEVAEQQPEIKDKKVDLHAGPALNIERAFVEMSEGLDLSFASISVSDGDYLPLVAIAAEYPTRARMNDIEGWWNEPELQKIRKKYCKAYAYRPDDLLIKVKDVLSNIV